MSLAATFKKLKPRRMPFAAAFANFRIRTKVSVGFGLVLIMLAVVGGTVVTSIDAIGTDFDTFLDRGRAVRAVGDIESAVLKIRRHTAEFAFTGEAESEAKARQAAKEAKEAADATLGFIKSPELRKKVEDIATSLAAYMKEFDAVVDFRLKQSALLSDVLDPAGPKLQGDFEQMAKTAASAGDGALEVVAMTGLQAVMAARLEVKDALATHNLIAAKKAENAFDHLRQTLKDIESATTSPEIKSLCSAVGTSIGKYFEFFQQAMNNAIEMDSLIHGEMTHNSDVIDEITETIKSGVQDEEKSIASEVHSIIGRSETMSVALVVLGLALGVGFAWLIGSGIAGPVVGMTGAMERLAGGDKSAEIPGAERKDEIGQMAATVQVFRDNMIKADQLAEAQRAEQERKEKRQKAIEGYIAQFDATVAAALKTLASASTELQATANVMLATADQTQKQSNAVAAVSEQATANVQTVASAADELSSSITEINRQVSESTRIAGQAVDEASSTDTKVQRLAEAASKIGDVVALISDIAGQTNLLALNATIEAARAGEAGKGFAVVASEVKSLATQTAKATEEISSLIAAIQGETQDSVDSIKAIGRTIGDINHIASTIASAVEQQGAATQEIARNVQQAAAGTSEVASNIGSVSEAAAQTGSAASQVLASAGELSQQAETLRAEVDTFLANIRAA
jgi:methyl-accepting chemotaxis protein